MWNYRHGNNISHKLIAVGIVTIISVFSCFITRSNQRMGNRDHDTHAFIPILMGTDGSFKSLPQALRKS